MYECEIWENINGFANYQISSYGRIYNKKTKYFKKLTINKKGYITTILQDGYINKGYRVHRLVAKAFIPNPENKLYVNHINGIKNDNRKENLNWSTNSENSQHAYNTGLTTTKTGIYNKNSKLTEKQVLEIYHAEGSHEKIGKHFNISRRTVGDIKAKNYWNHLLDNLDNTTISFVFLKESDLKDNRIEVKSNEILAHNSKPILNFPLYSIDIYGNILNINKKKYLQLSINKDGYYRVLLYNNGKRKDYLVHRLVAETHIPNPYNKTIVNHNNSIRTDNYIENLCWMTATENIQHAVNTGSKVGMKGVNNKMSKLNEKQICEIFFSKESAITLGNIYNISSDYIYMIKNRKTWKHITKNL